MSNVALRSSKLVPTRLAPDEEGFPPAEPPSSVFCSAFFFGAAAGAAAGGAVVSLIGASPPALAEGLAALWPRLSD